MKITVYDGLTCCMEIGCGEIARETPLFYRAKRNENMGSISRKFMIPLFLLLSENEGVRASEGAVIYLPKFVGSVYLVKPLDTLSSIAARFSITEEELKRKNNADYVYPSQVIFV